MGTLTRLWAAAAVVMLAAAVSAQVPFEVKWDNDHLSVSASTAPLAAVMTEVARLSGLEIVGKEKLTGDVSVRFVDHPLDKALAVLLERVNYSIQKRKDPEVPGGIRTVVRVLEMTGASKAKPDDGPIAVPGLDALVVDEAEDFADAKEADLDDPDNVEEAQEAKKEAYAMAAAGAFGPDADLNALAALAQNPNEEVRLEALKAIQTRPLQPVLQAVTHALGDESWDVRTTAVEILAAARDRESLNRIGTLLVGSDSRDVRIDVLRVLALRAQPESARHLEAYLKAKPKDDEGILRDAAGQMLAEFERRAEAAKREGK